MSQPSPITSRNVFVPRGTATYTPKWSIVVLAIACLGVLEFKWPDLNTSAERKMTPLEKTSPKGVLALWLKVTAPDAHQLGARGERMIDTGSNAPHFSASVAWDANGISQVNNQKFFGWP